LTWFANIHEEEFLAKWKRRGNEMGLPEDAIDFVFDELEYYKKSKLGKIEVSGVDTAWQADQLIDEELRESFLMNLPQLESEQRINGREERLPIFNIIDPSMYLFDPKVSRTIDEDLRPTIPFLGSGKIVKHKVERELTRRDLEQLTNYQWLPSEFILSTNGSVKIDSYINKLAPN
jgi:hypothetical protein